MNLPGIPLLIALLSVSALAQEIVFDDGFENHPPVITSMPVTAATVGESYAYDLEASDIDGDPLTYLLDSAPTGMGIAVGTGHISWVPGTSGQFAVTVRVADGQGGSATQSWNITVSEGVDSDADGLSDVTEIALGTDPGDPDSDADGLLDGAEFYTHGTNPLDPDSDADGLADGEEVYSHGTDPTDVDSDGDHFGDGFEIAYGSDPLDPDDFPVGPPDPEAIAPPNDPGISTNLAEAVDFLYNGVTPVQTGVAEGALEAVRVAVLRGLIVTRDGAPLAGVDISVPTHPEYGQTQSRVDGRYDMVVNGGGTLTVEYARAGYLTAQRQADVPWQDYVELPDLALVPLDTQATALDLTQGSMQMARGSESSDPDGTRRATLLFPAGTTAQLQLEGGGTQPIENLTIRATEYTVGAKGPEAMPGMLPAVSGYTYAVELSADEAFAAGVSGLEFSQPIYNYTENFLGFPVGTRVPTGYYDRSEARWVPSNNGLVIEILGHTGGLADVDVDGDGVADTGAALADLGFTDAERQNLASAYTGGQQLWRVPIEHFTPWDHNWPYGPPLDAFPPMLEQPQVEDVGIENPCPTTQPANDSNGLSHVDGSVIECQNQVLRKMLPVAGTPFLLSYRSTDVPDRRNGRRVRIPLSGPSIPARLKRIELEFSVAGQAHRQTFNAAPDLSTVFEWNGRDAYQRPVNGTQVLRGAVGYVYDAVYYEPGDYDRAFGRIGGAPLETNAARDEFIISQPITATLGSFDARSVGLGGWRLDVHHLYDPNGRKLLAGAGYTRGVASGSRGMVSTVAGVTYTEEGGWNGDDQPATQALLESPQAVLAMPDGSFLIADSNNHRIRKVGADGIIETIAGTGNAWTSGDGGLAVEAEVRYPEAMALGPDGSVYVVTHARVRRISPDGYIDTVVGTGPNGNSAGDGGPALDAALDRVRDIDVAPDGAIYIAELGSNTVRRVGTDGIIDRVAGTGNYGWGPDGVQATTSDFAYPEAVKAVPGGGFFVGDEGRIRFIGSDGIVQTVAADQPYEDEQGNYVHTLYRPVDFELGSDGLYFVDYRLGQVGRIDQQGQQQMLAGVYDAGTAYGDGGPPLAAGFYYVNGLSIDAFGAIYVADGGASQIRRIATPLPGFTGGDIYVASSDGSAVYQFDRNGRHLRTLNSRTSAVLLEFAYSPEGLLSTITDGDGKHTSIQRDGQGRPTGILGPYGQLTSLALDLNGFLSAIGNPAGEQVLIESSPGGLIEQWIDPRGKISQYQYDGQGFLLSQSDNTGYSQEFARAELADGFNVTRETVLGRTSIYAVQKQPDGTQVSTRTLADGSQIVGHLDLALGKAQTAAPTGVTSIVTMAGDPRFGLQAPFVEGLELSMSDAGPTLSASATIEAVLANPEDPLSLQTLNGTSTLAGRTSTSHYDAATRTLTLTSPEGRVSTLEYDLLGRIVSGQLGDLEPVTVSYNALGQLETLTAGTGPSARVSSFTYGSDGLRESITDPLGRQATLERDLAGRVTRTTLSGAVDIDFSYDAAGDLDGITPPGKPEHQFSYTLHGRPASVTPPAVPGSGPTTFAYNADRQLISITRPGEEQVLFGHDGAGRTQSIELKEGGVTTASYALSYLVADQLETITGPGAQSVTYEYAGDLVRSITWGGVVGGSVGWEYDEAFRVVREIVAGGAEVPFSYDNDDLLVSAGDLVIARDAINGLADGAALGLVADSWSYNGFGEIIAHTVTANSDVVYDVSFTHDALGRIVNKVETIAEIADSYDYVYDVRGQLTEVRKNDTVVESYTYDDNGNRTNATVYGNSITGIYDDQDRLLTYGASTYSYTPDGRLMTRNDPGDLVTAYDYDVLGNLNGVSLPDETEIAYRVDGHDRRVQRSVEGSISHRWLYDGILPIAELDEFDNPISQFVYAGGKTPAYLIRNGVSYRMVVDPVGSVRLVIDSSTGAIVQRLDYDSFGNVISDSNPGFQPFGFAGGLYDAATQLIRFGLRDYDPYTGRWTSVDPIRFGGGGFNLYQYSLNDPINLSDPTGLMPDWCVDQRSFWQRFLANREITTGVIDDSIEKLIGDAVGMNIPGIPFFGLDSIIDLIFEAKPINTSRLPFQRFITGWDNFAAWAGTKVPKAGAALKSAALIEALAVELALQGGIAIGSGILAWDSVARDRRLRDKLCHQDCQKTGQ